jgi:hypothetical protein
MVVAVVLLSWTCAVPWLPPELPDRTAKDVARQEFVRRWLELRMERSRNGSSYAAFGEALPIQRDRRAAVDRQIFQMTQACSSRAVIEPRRPDRTMALLVDMEHAIVGDELNAELAQEEIDDADVDEVARCCGLGVGQGDNARLLALLAVR